MYQSLKFGDQFYGETENEVLLAGIAHTGIPAVLRRDIPFIDLQISAEDPGQLNLNIAGLLFYSVSWDHVDFVRNLHGGLLVYMGPKEKINQKKLCTFSSERFSEHVEDFCFQVAEEILLPISQRHNISEIEGNISSSLTVYNEESDVVRILSIRELPNRELSFSSVRLVKDTKEVFIEMSLEGLEFPLLFDGFNSECLLFVKSKMLLKDPTADQTWEVDLTSEQAALIKELASAQMLHSVYSPYNFEYQEEGDENNEEV